MACAKVKVTALVIGRSGKWYDGENTCANPQEVCPRQEGEGYEKCRSVCGQHHHAEVQALAAAGDDACGGIILVNHHHCCVDCQRACDAAGISQIVLTKEPK